MNTVKIISSNCVAQILAVEWKVDNFFAISAEKIKSKTFAADFCKSCGWFISVYPDFGKMNPEHVGHVGVFLGRQNKRNKSVVSFKTKLFNEKRVLIAPEATTGEFKLESGAWGFPDMMAVDSLRGMIGDGALIVRMDITYEHIEDPWLAKVLRRIKANAGMIDNDSVDFKVVVTATGQEIGVHKAIMSSAWPHFKTMVDTPMDEAKENKWNIVDFDYKTMKAIVLYTYTDYFEAGSVEEAMDIMRAAHQYKIDDLLKLAEEYVAENMQLEHVFELLVAADLLGMPALKVTCFEKLAETKRANPANFKVTAIPGFEQFTAHTSTKEVMDFVDELVAHL